MAGGSLPSGECHFPKTLLALAEEMLKSKELQLSARHCLTVNAINGIKLKAVPLVEKEGKAQEG